MAKLAVGRNGKFEAVHGTTEDGYPCFQAELRPTIDGRVEVWFDCPYCKKRHHHGWVEGDNPAGAHRESHCWDDRSPVFHKGIVLRVDPAAPLGEMVEYGPLFELEEP